MMTPATKPTRHVLATDLDGTLIPLAGNSQHQRDLQTLTDQLVQHEVELVYVTGRHFDSVVQAIREFDLPLPQWIICDVGTSIYQQVGDGFHLVEPYYHHQNQIVNSKSISELREMLSTIEGLRLQEAIKQGPYKLSYYADAQDLERLVATIGRRLQANQSPYGIIHSVDPFNGDGLIDLLPQGVSKSHAIAWWIRQLGISDDGVLFAGDSGNDYAALTAGYRSILVGNADPSLVAQVRQAHRDAAWSDRLYLARNSATSGVLEGYRWFRSMGTGGAERLVNRVAETRLGS